MAFAAHDRARRAKCDAEGVGVVKLVGYVIRGEAVEKIEDKGGQERASGFQLGDLADFSVPARLG